MKKNALDRGALQRRAHTAAATSAEIDIAAQQRRSGKWSRDHDRFVLEALIAEEALALSYVDGKIVKVGLRNGGSYFLGPNFGRKRDH